LAFRVRRFEVSQSTILGILVSVSTCGAGGLVWASIILYIEYTYMLMFYFEAWCNIPKNVAKGEFRLIFLIGLMLSSIKPSWGQGHSPCKPTHVNMSWNVTS